MRITDERRGPVRIGALIILLSILVVAAFKYGIDRHNDQQLQAVVQQPTPIVDRPALRGLMTMMAARGYEICRLEQELSRYQEVDSYFHSQDHCDEFAFWAAFNPDKADVERIAHLRPPPISDPPSVSDIGAISRTK